MADKFLQREFIVRIEPAIMLLNSMAEMLKFTLSAVLIVKGDKIQMIGTTLDRSSYATLDTIQGVKWNPPDCALHIDLLTWLWRLKYSVLRRPYSLLSIVKPSGSNNLNFALGNNEPMMDLFAAQFVQQTGIDITDFTCKVKVTIFSKSFREAIKAFRSRYNGVRLDIKTSGSTNTVCWVASSEDQMTHAAVLDFMCDSITGSDLQLQVKWEWPLFNVITSILKVYGLVEISVLTDEEGIYWHHFRFLVLNGNSFSYMEKRPTRG